MTAFESPGRMVSNLINAVEFELNQELMPTIEERSGSVWTLDK